MSARYPDSFSRSDASIWCHPWRMRAVAASGNRTVPFDVTTDSTRVADSYFSIVPRSLSVVDDDGGADWTKPSEASAAARIRSGSRFLAMSLAARSNGLASHQSACPSPPVGYNPVKTWLTAG